MTARVLIGVGTNLGTRLTNLRAAVSFLRNISVDNYFKTSFLYETPPAYVIDQPRFLNAVVEICTDLAPLKLLERLKEGEDELGRVKTIRFGPRQIDMDILSYDDLVFSNEILTIPHMKLQEREFVLRPICDICPNKCHPVLKESYASLLSKLDKCNDMYTVLPIGSDHPESAHCKERVWYRHEHTRVMGVLNATPDSFSDGTGTIFSVTEAVKIAQDMERVGAAVLDIGGQSTKPGAVQIDSKQEIERVVPIITEMRSPGSDKIKSVISIDTFRSEVAEAAILAGADIINDVSAGRLDEKMFSVAAKYDIPIILMHSRGDSSNMVNLKNYDDVFEDVCTELLESVEAALAAGICRWNIIIDLGIGFAKGLKENLEILKKLKLLKLPNYGEEKEGGETRDSKSSRKNVSVAVRQLSLYPMLVGPSRKKFLGTLVTTPAEMETSGVRPPKGRDFATAAVISASVEAHASIVRVHNVQAMMDVIAVANEIYR